MYRAFDIADANGRITLARQALEISPDCADAYVVLAETARTEPEALEYYTKGVAAGERALGSRTFREDVGHFWGLLHTRPYMRARMGLAQALADMGRPEEAIRHWQEMLRLNPGDNQGVRHGLLSRLLQHDRGEEAAALIARVRRRDGLLGLQSRAARVSPRGRHAGEPTSAQVGPRAKPICAELSTPRGTASQRAAGHVQHRQSRGSDSVRRRRTAASGDRRPER